MNTLCCSFAEVSGYLQDFKESIRLDQQARNDFEINSGTENTFPLKSLVYLFSLLNDCLAGNRPALCWIFFLLYDSIVIII